MSQHFCPGLLLLEDDSILGVIFNLFGYISLQVTFHNAGKGKSLRNVKMMW